MMSGDEFYDDDVTSGLDVLPPEACPICRMVRWGITPTQEATAARLSSDGAPLCGDHAYMRVVERVAPR